MHENDQSTMSEEIEGLDTSEIMGWGDYPLDSVFIRQEYRTVSEVVKRIKRERFILNPDFQKDFAWSVKKQSKLIESCLMRIPLPVLYVAEAEDGRIIVVDGLQRLTTFMRYLNDEFSLSKLGDGKEDAPRDNPLIGKKFSELPLNLQERVEDTQLILYVLDYKAPHRSKLNIFERVNSGEPLARQQMRNCLFSGPATKWLRKAAESKPFLTATGKSLNKKTMRDREAINRFCAFSLLGVEQYKGDMEDFLAKCLEKMNQTSDKDIKTLTHTFRQSMESNYLLFEKHAFRKSLAAKDTAAARYVINMALFDVCSVIFSRLDPSVVEQKGKKISEVIISLLNENDFNDSITYATNASKQVVKRFEMMEQAIREVV
ncbi:DUF262 domain-containing protein [Desulfobacterales bacterium HSG2]|nr:DUF262 domain-containing protein [Desulfobacterales bacterium HSG2]